ncbi:hypothetical protein [Nonomuraea sp. LPB2021202275-12-8]|uniref:hypothetical protein n=1 Tax=Nonomuraea sp. LPB2021202275-12-8 TaxID=3120159 RepID=UPI00300C4649
MTTVVDHRTKTISTVHKRTKNHTTLVHVDTTPHGYTGAILQHSTEDGGSPRYTVHVHRLLFGWLQISTVAIQDLGGAKTVLKSSYEVSAATYQPVWPPMIELLNLALADAATEKAA